MSTLWVLTANRGFAKIYEVKGKGREIKEIYYIENPDGQKKDSEVVSDRPGRAFDRLGAGRHSLSKKVDFHGHEQDVFAHKLADILLQGHNSKAYDQLAFVAPAHFLGGLNRVIASNVKNTLIQEVDSNLPEHLNEQDRIEHLRKYLNLWNEAKKNI